MSTQPQKLSNKPNLAATLWTLTLLGVLIGGYLTHPLWGGHIDALVTSFKAQPAADAGHAGHDGGAHADHDEASHADHDEPTSSGMEDSLKLTELQQRNLGLKTGVVEVSDFVKHTIVQAVVVDRPGRSKVQIAAHAAGIVTDVFQLERQVVEPGMPLLKMRMIHEDVVGLQTDFLDALSKRDMLNTELERLEQIGTEIIAGKRLINKRNELDLANSTLQSLQQSLILHGVDEEELEKIQTNRQLIQNETVVVPPHPPRDKSRVLATPRYHVQSINVNRGQTVQLGQTMLTLADYSLLYVKGMAFEDDAAQLMQLAQSVNENRSVSVIVDGGPNAAGDKADSNRLELNLESVADTIDPDSRQLNFYLELPNESADQGPVEFGLTSNEPQFVSWKFRPGQRMQVMIPGNQSMKDKIILPTSAVVIDGPNAFVFERNGDHFDRLEVEVLYRDSNQVVLENDGALVGATIAFEGAYRMHLALKNESGGGFDPHAGHSH